MVLSTYWSWAFLASFCTVVFSCLYLTQSVVLFVCLALENAFCRLRSKRVMSVVIHGFDGLFLEIFDGTRSAVMITDIAFLKSFHLSFTDVYCVLMIFSVASCIWLPIMDLSALFHNMIFLGLERCWCAVSARSISTVSWSLLPNAGNALHLSMIVGCDVKSKSSVFCPRVGKSTICSKARSCCMDINSSLTRLGN